MGLYREAFESRMADDRKRYAQYGPPATADQIAAAERVLGLPLPAALRELYVEFDGLWFDELGRTVPPDDDTEWWEVLPLRLLGVGRGMLARLYGGTADYPSDGFDEQLGRCVPFRLPEYGASFLFITDREAWAFAPGRVGGWEHHGGECDSAGSLVEWLAEIGEMRSLGQ